MPSRRRRAGAVIALVAAVGLPGGAAPAQDAVELAHRVEIDVPLIADNPAAIPITVSVDHPMDPDHYIESLELVLDSDPVPHKGTFLLTPLAGRASVSFQMRSGRGGELRAIAVCSRHGRFEARQMLEVAPGGCAGIPPAEEAGSPSVWTTAAAGGSGVIPLWAKIRHSSHAGLVERGGRLVREGEPFYLRKLTLLLAGRQVSELRLTPAVSPDPQVRLFLRSEPGKTVRVVFENNKGGRWAVERKL